MPPTTQQKLSVDDFAQQIKDKYPVYESIDNNTLVQKMLDKYPVYKDRVDMGTPTATPPSAGVSGIGNIGRVGAPTTAQPQQNFAQKAGSMVAGAGKGIWNFLTSSEQGFGNSIADAIGGNMMAKGIQETNQKMSDADLHYVQALMQGRKNALAKGLDTSNYDKQLKNFQASSGVSLAEMFPSINKSKTDVLLEAGGVAGDILTAGTYGKAAKGMEAGRLAVKAVPTVVEKVEEQAGKKALAKVTELVSPRLSLKEAEKTAVTKPKGILGKILPIASERTKQIAEAVKSVVSPSRTFSENATRVYEAIGKEAENLKTLIKANDKPYEAKELQSALKAIEVPEFIKTSEATVQKRASRIVDKFMEIAKGKDGMVSSILDARKEFDTWVRKEYPRVFDESGNAINTLVKNVRTAANDFIAKNVPDVAVKDSLRTQNLMYEAHDILTKKAVRGAPRVVGEIGTTRIGRFAARNPGKVQATKAVAKTAAKGLGIGAAAGAGYEAFKHLIP